MQADKDNPELGKRFTCNREHELRVDQEAFACGDCSKLKRATHSIQQATREPWLLLMEVRLSKCVPLAPLRWVEKYLWLIFANDAERLASRDGPVFPSKDEMDLYWEAVVCRLHWEEDAFAFYHFY